MSDTAKTAADDLAVDSPPRSNSERSDSQPRGSRLRVGVLMGGRSGEREVSLASGRQVYHSLDPSRYAGTPLYMDLSGRLWALPDKLVIQNTCTDVDERLAQDAEVLGLEDLAERVDIVFVTLHGKYGDDGCIQGALELVDLPYTGSGVLACGLSLDKPRAHALMSAHGFDVPRELTVPAAGWTSEPDAWRQRVTDRVGYPAVVLPAREGSSLGVSMVETVEVLDSAVEEAFKWDERALVEERLEGMEFSVIVIGNDTPEALLPTEVVTDNPWMTYEDKYMPGRSQKITPPRVDDDTLARIRAEAERLYQALGFAGYARLDGFLTTDDRLIFNDPNSTSGMAPSSFMFHQAAEAGMTPRALVDRILQLGLEAHASKAGPL